MARYERRKWRGQPGAVTRRERIGGFYRRYIPDPLGGREFDLSSTTAAALEDAAGDLARLETSADALTNTETLARLLLRAEAVGSSQIEGLVVGARRLLRAEALRASGEASSDVTAGEVLGNIDAMAWTAESVQAGDELTVENLLEAHRRLMTRTALSEIGGQVRIAQNWIGGSTPADAAFVPPPPEQVVDLLEDLMAFTRTSDMPALAKAAIAHAQFETIHPFADGNGRTGRALIHITLRAEGLSSRTVPPISLSLATHSDAYIAALTEFRHQGLPTTKRARASADRWLAMFARACSHASSEAARFEQAVSELKSAWRAKVAPTRADSTALRLIDLLPAAPVITLATASRLTGRSQQAANVAIARLVAVGILRQITIGRRNRAFEAPDLITAFTALERRFASPVGDTQVAPAVRPVPSRPRPRA